MISNHLKTVGAVIIEDDRMFSELLARSLIDVAGLRLLARAYSVEEGIRACLEHRPQLVILDLALPDGSGLDVLRHLTESRLETDAVILSAHADDLVAPKELKDNIVAVVSKAEAYRLVNEEVRQLIKVRLPGVEDEAALVESLTPRELEVFGLLGEGLTTQAIAKRLNRSAATIATHRKVIALKLRCSGAALMAMAARHYSRFVSIP